MKSDARAGVAAELLQPYPALAGLSAPALAAALLGHGKVIEATHQQLADELGSVREIVTRVLRSFADQGMVRLGRGSIEMLDAPGLRKIAAGE